VTRPDGAPGTFVSVHFTRAVFVLALDAEERVHLARQFRYGAGTETLEVVAGALEDGEDAAGAARRELREEIGREASEWIDLGTFELDTSIVRSTGQLFVARCLTRTQTDQDSTEDITCVTLPLAEAVRKVMEGEIVHAPSILLILKAARHLTR
jgi:8-oxo-dGTP pyrophosphatase MutT (NUDIX family)